MQVMLGIALRTKGLISLSPSYTNRKRRRGDATSEDPLPKQNHNVHGPRVSGTPHQKPQGKGDGTRCGGVMLSLFIAAYNILTNEEQVQSGTRRTIQEVRRSAAGIMSGLFLRLVKPDREHLKPDGWLQRSSDIWRKFFLVQRDPWRDLGR